jgi:hypothetical protein
MKRAYILVSALVMFISCSIVGPEKNSLILKIQGIVTDGINGSPVSNVEVRLYKKYSPSIYDEYEKDEMLDSDITAENGFYYLEYKLYGECLEKYLDLWVIDSTHFYDWHTVGYWHEPHVRCTEEIQVIDIQLERQN